MVLLSLLALLVASVQYVVRVSTHNKYMSPTHGVLYGWAHWADENLLSQPEFGKLKWASLQLNFFKVRSPPGPVTGSTAYRNTMVAVPIKIVPGADAKWLWCYGRSRGCRVGRRSPPGSAI